MLYDWVNYAFCSLRRLCNVVPEANLCGSVYLYKIYLINEWRDHRLVNNMEINNFWAFHLDAILYFLNYYYYYSFIFPTYYWGLGKNIISFFILIIKILWFRKISKLIIYYIFLFLWWITKYSKKNLYFFLENKFYLTKIKINVNINLFIIIF